MGRPRCHHGMEQKERMEDFGPRRPCMCALAYSVIIYNIIGRTYPLLQEPGHSIGATTNRPSECFGKTMECAVHVCWRLAVSRLGQQVD